jgi:hypothetical protein
VTPPGLRWVRVAPGQYSLIERSGRRAAVLLQDSWSGAWAGLAFGQTETVIWEWTLKDAKRAAEAAVARRRGTG